MRDNLLAVCRELDDLMIRALELMEKQIECKLKLEETMKLSCLDLAKARYIMGNNNVSYLQLPTEDSDEITALRTVTSTVETKKKLEHKVFELRTISPEKKLSGKQEEENCLIRRTGEGARKKIEDLNHKKDEGNGIMASNDPIKWFGYLVPQNLRQAQKGFHSALELVIQSANIQSELVATRNKCDDLLKLKNTLSVTHNRGKV